MTDQAKPDTARLTDAIGPLPDYAPEFRPRWPGDDGGFTGAQMRLYAMQAVAAERERLLSMPRLMHACDAVGVPANGEYAAHLRDALCGPNT